MKKTLAILLILTMVFSLLAVPVSAEGVEADICFAVAADLHYEYQEEELEWYSEDPVFGYANRRAAMENESTYIIDEFLNQCAENDKIEFILIPGDLANNGKRFLDQHIKVAEKLRAFEAKSGKPVYVINGNHDVGMVGEYCETGMTEFRDAYFEFGFDEALATMEGNLSYTANLGDKYRLIAADSCDYDRSTGDGMTEDKVEWVVEQARLAVSEGRYPILIMHHNLLDHMPIQSVLSKDFIIRNHISTADKFANAGIKLVFTGHEHCSDATTYTSSKGYQITDFATTSLTMYPLQYRVMEMTDETIFYKAETIDTIDTENLRDDVIGYTDAHIEEMNKGMNEYAKKFLKNGVEYRLERGFQDEQLGIDKSAFYYDLVRNAVDTLNGILNTPLYGEGSVQEMAKENGIEIPNSEYTDGWDVATELVSAHYAGEEHYPLMERDVTILIRTMCFIIDSELSMITEDEFMAAAAAITALYGSTPSDELAEKLNIDSGYSHGIQSFVLALASPLLDSFANDDEVPDNNGAIKGYAKTSTTDNINNITASVSVTLEKLFERLAYIINFVFKALDYIEM